MTTGSDDKSTNEQRRPRQAAASQDTGNRWRFDSAVEAARHLGSARR
jgi:hypothetical protein